MADFRVGDRVRWQLAQQMPGNSFFTVTETGLESAILAMPGEQVRVRRADGSLTRVWVADIELVPGAERGPLP